MDRSPLKEALEKAKLIVSSHGMVRYMPSYSKNTLSSEITDFNDKISFDFFLYPEKSVYSNNNFNCSLHISYLFDHDVERDGGIYRDYKLHASVRMSSAELTLKTYKSRENMVESLFMLVEMIDTVAPKNITITVMTPEALKEKRTIEHEQLIASKIFEVLGKDAVKNLRIGGKSKVTRLPEKFIELNGSMPEPGKYRFEQVRSVNRRGQIKDRAGFMFIVNKSLEDSYFIRAFRTS